MTVAEQVATTIRQLIRERLAVSQEPDPHVLASELVGELDEDVLRDALLPGITELVKEQVRQQRRHVPTGSRKWEQVAETVALNGDIFQRRYPTPEGWKLLGDLTHDDALWNQHQYEERARANMDEAHCFELLAKSLRGKKLARDLGRDKVEEIFNA